MKKRLWIGVLLSAVLAVLMTVGAVAEETEGTAEPVCTCAALCTADGINETCPVCVTNWTACTGSTLSLLGDQGDSAVEISTADQLMELLKTTYTDSYSTQGKIYQLTTDLQIDTSALETSYSIDSGGSSRVFMGILDGNGHTVTVMEGASEPSQPLFDSLRGSSPTNHAEVKNLKLVFKGNVAGTTVAAHTSYASITDVDIFFEKDIQFAHTSGGHAVATGVYAFTSNGIDIAVTDVTITATGEAPYGVIGSKEAQNARYVMAAGVYTEHNAAGGGIVCDGVTVDVRGIYAVSNYQSDKEIYSACCAAGIASGFYQSNTNLGNIKVVIQQDISASAVEGAITDVDAYGLAYKTNSLYNCNIEVFGSILALPNEGSLSWDYSTGYAELNSSAMGIGYNIATDNNQSLYQANNTGIISVNVYGDIAVKAPGIGGYPWFSIASGCAYNVGYDVPWSNVNIKICGEVLAENASEEGYGGYSPMAYACGFSVSEEYGYYLNDFDLVNYSIDARAIIANAPSGMAIACGAILQNYGMCKDCIVTVEKISAEGTSAAAAGFSYTLNPDRSGSGAIRTTLYNCLVTLGTLEAYSEDSEIAGLVCGLLKNYSTITEKVESCSVVIREALYAKTKGLLISSNSGQYNIINNTVTLPRDQADVQTIDGVEYVLFTASEVDGQAENTDWQSGNKVIFTNHSENDVTCAYDDGDTPYGTLWRLNTTKTTYTVTYQYTGTVPQGAPFLPSAITLWPDAEVTVEAAPALAGYTFSGWTIQSPDGVTITDGKFTMPSADVVLVGSWMQNAPPTYSLTYNANYEDNPATIDGGTHEAGTTMTLNGSDTFLRDGYKLVGWNTAADGSGTSYAPGSTFTMPADTIILYAQWEENAPPVVGTVTIRLADVTIYMGGEDGYDGAVNSDYEIVSTDSLPVPGFVVTLPEELADVSVTDLILEYQDGDNTLQWEFEKYGDGEHDLYRIDPKEGTVSRPVRMKFTDATGKIVTDDQFVITDHLKQTLTMEIYGEGIQAGEVVAVYQGVSYPVTTGSEPARLTVRGTTDNAEYGKIHTDVAWVSRGEPGLVVPEGTVYTINGTPVQVDDPSGITLLFDDIIENKDIAGTSNTDLLIQRAEEVLAEMEGTSLSWWKDRRYEAKYLNLVDTNNGNAWVVANQEITICWPLPEGTNENTNFVLLHFEGLHREIGTSAIPNAIDQCTISQVDVQVNGDHITFTVDYGGFSPFLLVWETVPDKPDNPPLPGGNDDGSSKPDTAPELNAQDHYAYIVGYEDDTVRPEGYLTRAEVATIFFRLLTDVSREQFWTTRSAYSDVNQEVWYNNAIATMTNAGILKGYEDGTFRPDTNITRAEFAAIASRFDSSAAETDSGFTDIAGHWAAAEISRAVSLGWIQGYEDGTFRPDQPITRAEVMTIVNRMLDRVPENETDLLPDMNIWSDNLPGTWYYLAVQEATNSHTYIRKNGGYETWVAMLEDPDWTRFQ